MRKRRHMDRDALPMVVGGAAFVLAGSWMMGTPDGLAFGAVTVIFFGSVLAIGVVRMRLRDGPLPVWAVLVSSGAFTLASAYLLFQVVNHPRWSVGDVALAAACAVGVLFFGGGGIAYLIQVGRR